MHIYVKAGLEQFQFCIQYANTHTHSHTNFINSDVADEIEPIRNAGLRLTAGWMPTMKHGT